MSEKDKAFLPTRAVRYWARKYQRKADGRLVKIENKPSSEEQQSPQYHPSDLTHAEGLSGFREIASEPVTRSNSLEKLVSIKVERKSSVGDLRLSGESISSGSVKFSSEVDTSRQGDEMGEVVEEALKRLAVSVEKDNSKLLPPLPYFSGKCERSSNASEKSPWILYNCGEFISMIEDAVENDKWTETGKLRTLQDRLLGPARDYWRVRNTGDIITLKKAGEYLLSRFPNTDTYASITSQITDFKRRPGETLSEIATRIQILCGKLQKVQPEIAASKSTNMLELFFKGLPEDVRDHVGEEKDFSKAVQKSIEYLERHREFKLRNRDIMLETTFKTEAKVNNVNIVKKNGESGEKNKNMQTHKKDNGQRKSKGKTDQSSLNNINFRGNSRGNFNGRNRFSGNNRGNFRGRSFQNNQGNRGSYSGNRGYANGNWNRGSRQNNRNYYGNSYRGASNTYNSRGPTCYTCGKFGHTSNMCYANKNKGKFCKGNEGSSKEQGNGKSCWTCGGMDHLAKDCAKKNE